MARLLRITGIVQGVGYRASFEMQARRLQLAGWVRNRIDGSVEALVHGNPEAVEQIIAWAWRGPAAAQVRGVAVSEVADDGITQGRFDVLATA
jgi:acylphosphatase